MQAEEDLQDLASVQSHDAAHRPAAAKNPTPIHRHQDVPERDTARQELMDMYGIHFYRCTAREMESNLEKVLQGNLEAAGISR